MKETVLETVTRIESEVKQMTSAKQIKAYLKKVREDLNNLKEKEWKN